MGEIRKKLGLTKITFRNFFLLILVMMVMAVIGLMSKSMKGGLGESNNPPNWLINQANADTPGGGCDGASGEGGSCSAGCDSEASF